MSLGFTTVKVNHCCGGCRKTDLVIKSFGTAWHTEVFSDPFFKGMAGFIQTIPFQAVAGAPNPTLQMSVSPDTLDGKPAQTTALSAIKLPSS